MLVRRRAGRRAGGGPLERLAQIRKRYPQDWNGSKPDLIRSFARHAGRMYGINFTRDELHFREFATVRPSRKDGMLPWLWREVRRGAYDPERFHEASPDLLRIVGWYVEERPDLMAFTLTRAHGAMLEWEAGRAGRVFQQALKRARGSFKPVGRSRQGWWGLRKSQGGPPAHVLTISRAMALGLEESWVKWDVEPHRMFVLFDLQGMPRVFVLLGDDGLVRRARGWGDNQVEPDDDFAPALVAFLRKVVGRRPSPAWGEGVIAVGSLPMRDMLGVDASILGGWAEAGRWIDRNDPSWRKPRDHAGGYWQSSPLAEAAGAVQLLLDGPDDDTIYAWPSTGADTSWSVERAWPKDQKDGDNLTALDWIKPYPLPAGEAPTFIRAEMVYTKWDTVDYDMRCSGWWYFAQEHEDEVEALGVALRAIWRARGNRASPEPDAAEWAEEQIKEDAWYFIQGQPRTVRRKSWQVLSYEMDDDLRVVGSIDAGRTVRKAKTPEDVIQVVKDVLATMQTHLEWWIGGRRGHCEYDYEYSRGLEHALRYLTLKHVTKDVAAADAFFEKHKIRPREPRGRSNRRRRR